MNIGEKIKELRIKKGMTQEELAVECKLSKNAIWNYENNKRTPGIQNLEKISKALGVPLSLLTGDVNNKIENKILSENKRYINMLENLYIMLGQCKIDGFVCLDEIEDKIVKIGMDNYKKVLPLEDLEYLVHSLSIVITLKQYFEVDNPKLKESLFNSLEKMVKFKRIEGE
ncbi:anaerobic benzoate catabolism transcriptional regulator [Clostridium tepidiprofundi DSM 19306]|uniref:Anaerobic benzoate catabolism transcriptional regulator n=1 Tax=Clostridium tepidiprofundi DSM 19306 TaxID=1121338 RepID=A0A151AMP8_9CLOT|nr:helix-turn-helix transcriptional regulator [Clostridium tepidiprofundi]KYH28901.1 anaerobic benzoate catabolism transcriptional regulator [Clostridium tepidiprofundi DSM 19306]